MLLSMRQAASIPGSMFNCQKKITADPATLVMAGRHNIDAADIRHLQSADGNIGHDTHTTCLASAEQQGWAPGPCAEGPPRSGLYY